MHPKKRKTSISKISKKMTRVTVNFLVAQHRKLKSLAALEGVSLQEYIRSRVIATSKDMDISDAELNPVVVANG